MDTLTIYTESPGGCRKRKRECYGADLKKQQITETSSEGATGILNAAFSSSTPNKNLVRNTIRRSTKRTQLIVNNKENYEYECMEVKSIADIHKSKIKEIHDKGNHELTENPFEVLRKPPKKKKKSEIEESCFENQALNLQAPERTLNPFEIRRSSPQKLSNEVKEKCFINNGLDIRVEDSNINPYEITRLKSPIRNLNDGIENPALEISSPKSVSMPTNITIGLPFKPTMGCRIDFHNVPLKNFLNAENCNSKDQKSPNTQNKLLPVITEDVEIDIGKELDSYQLELENSINEAKLKKANIDNVKSSLNVIKEILEENDKNDFEKITQEIRSNNISGIVPLEDVNDDRPMKLKHEIILEKSTELLFQQESSILDDSESRVKTPDVNFKTHSSDETNENNESKNDSISDSEYDEPGQFIRFYTKPTGAKVLSIDEPKEINKEQKSKIGSAIRRSIRKFINHQSKNSQDKITELNDNSNEKEPRHHNIFTTLRQSLRRKPPKMDIKSSNKQNEISIIDCTERTKIFRSPKPKFQTKETEKIRNIFSKNNKYNF